MGCNCSLGAPEMKYPTDDECFLTIPFFDEMNNKTRKALYKYFNRRMYQTNEIVMEEGEVGLHFILILSGRLELSITHNQRKFILGEKVASQFLGEFAVVGDSLKPVTVRAVEPSLIATLDRPTFLRCVNEYPQFHVCVKMIGRDQTTVRLRSIPFFRNVDEMKLQLLACLFSFEKYTTGHVLFSEGDQSSGFFIVLKGMIKITAKERCGSQEAISLGLVKEFEFLGEVSLLQNRQRTGTATCVKDTSLLHLGVQEFRSFLKCVPEVSNELNKVLKKRTANDLAAVSFFSALCRRPSEDDDHRDEVDMTRLELLSDLFRYAEYSADDMVFSEGEVAVNFYVIVKGTVSVTRRLPNGEDAEIDRLHAGFWFGEMALLSQQCLRTASVRAKEPCLFIALSREHFAQFLEIVPEFQEKLESLLSMRTASSLRVYPLFDGFTPETLEIVAELFHFRQHASGDVVIRENDVGDTFHIVTLGAFSVCVQGMNKQDIAIDRLSPGDFFGEVALISNEHRTATITAVCPSITLCLVRNKFQRFLDIAPNCRRIFLEAIQKRHMNHQKFLSRKLSKDSTSILAALQQLPLFTEDMKNSNNSSDDSSYSHQLNPLLHPPADQKCNSRERSSLSLTSVSMHYSVQDTQEMNDSFTKNLAASVAIPNLVQNPELE